MAVSKFIGAIHAPKGNYKTLKNTINYILNGKKTQDGLYTGACHCRCSHALEDMTETQRFYGKQPHSKRDRAAYHMCISWQKDCDITPEIALDICAEFCQEYLKDYEVVYSVHTDQPHIHAHICFNAVSFRDGYKYQYKNGDWEKVVRPMVDRICERHGIPTLAEELEQLEDRENEYEKKERKARQNRRRDQKQNQEGSGSNRKYYNEKEETYSQSDHLRVDIDHAIMECSSWQNFLSYLLNMGYEVKTGKYFAIRGLGMDRYRRTYQLGDDYSEENIKKRIEAKRSIPKIRLSKQQEYPLEEKLKTVGKICLTNQSRKHYAMQYRAGLLKPGQNRAYYAIRKALKEKQRQEQIKKLLDSKGITDEISAKKVLYAYPAEIEKQKRKKKDLQEKLAPYAQLIHMYQSCKELKDSYECFKNNHSPVLRQDYEKYQEFLSLLRNYRMSEKQFSEFCNSVDMEMENINRDIRELNKEQKIIRQYLGLEKLEKTQQKEEWKGKDWQRKNTREFGMAAKGIGTGETEDSVAITINESLVVEESPLAYKTRVPGTYGENVCFLWVSKEDSVVTDDGKTLYTRLNKRKGYSLETLHGKMTLRGDALYEEHYNKVLRQKIYQSREENTRYTQVKDTKSHR